MNDVLQYFNIVVKNALRQKNYHQVGRFPKFFLSQDQETVEGMSYANRCRKWPGYEVTTKQCTAGIFLNVDACTKFVREQTVLEEINERLEN